MARRWRFPDAIATAIETHHADERSPSGSDSFSRLVRLGLCAAESILAEPAQAEAALDRFRRLGAIWFDIKPREALALLQQISDMSKELADVFDMDAGDPVPIEELMDRAEAEKNRQALVDPLAAEKSQADIDPITHLPDRKRFLAEFETAFGDSKDMKRPLGLVLVSIDEGRRLANAPADSGDGRLLASAAALVRSTINAASPLYRFVGAEFVAVLEGANATVAAQVGDFIRQRFASAPIFFEDDEGGPDRRELTVTVGVAALEPNEASGLTTTSPDAVLQAAMCAVATGQRSGGNVLVRGGGAASDGHDDLASVA
jgi:diguanylate cyclase (GGDEF)-like protein